MGAYIDIVMKNLAAINWEGPASFLIIIMVILAILRKWSIFLITLFTIVLGWGAQDLIISNMSTSEQLITLPILIYCFGGIIIVILLMITFFKLSI